MNDNTRPDWYYEQLHLGFNYRMTDFQAALGASQIRRLGKFLKQRRRIASSYKRLLNSVDLKLPNFEELEESSWHLFVVETIGGSIEGKRDDLFRLLRNAGILVNLHYIPVYRHPYFTKLGFDPRNFPVAEEYYRRAISLPIYAGLTGFQQRKVSRHIVNFLKKK
jgi:dTDP-4-amino-4,6-dideoxygalactose transaminase